MKYEEAVKEIKPGRYRHFKGNEYEVIAVARHSETTDPMVVYRALYGDYGTWVRPADMWNETIERDGKTCKRFERIDMEFRRLTEQDLQSLLELYKQLQPEDETSSAEKSKAVWQEIENDPNIQYFGAVDKGKVVSTCYAVYIPNLTRNNRGICLIENVVTDIDYRNQGLASRVIDMAVAYAKEKDCYKVILQSGITRVDAHQFYENKGFDGSSKKAFDMRLEYE